MMMMMEVCDILFDYFCLFLLLLCLREIQSSRADRITRAQSEKIVVEDNENRANMVVDLDVSQIESPMNDPEVFSYASVVMKLLGSWRVR